MLREYGSKKDATWLTSETTEQMPTGSLKLITDRLPAIVDYSFDRDAIAIVPIRQKWFGMYFGKFNMDNPMLGIVFMTGFRHFRFYLWRHTIIIGSVAPQQLNPIGSLQEVIFNEIEQRGRDFFAREGTEFHNQRIDGAYDSNVRNRTDQDTGNLGEPLTATEILRRQADARAGINAPGALIEREHKGEGEVTP